MRDDKLDQKRLAGSTAFGFQGDQQCRKDSERGHLRVAPGARPHFDVSRDAPLAEFEKVAARYPVFRILPDRIAGNRG